MAGTTDGTVTDVGAGAGDGVKQQPSASAEPPRAKRTASAACETFEIDDIRGSLLVRVGAWVGRLYYSWLGDGRPRVRTPYGRETRRKQ